MPLILLGLLVVIGIVIYALVIYGQSEKDFGSAINERVSSAFDSLFEWIMSRVRRSADYTIIDDDDNESGCEDPDSEKSDQTLFFPTDAEIEKRKRNIH